REKKLDNMLRKSRTKREAKILEKASKSGIPCPRLLEVSEFTITMSIIKGQNAEANEKNVKEAGKILEQLHSLNIIHGDYTFANLMFSDNRLFVIDFGLGYFSNKIEHKAVDVFTMLLSLHDDKLKNIFLESYLSNSKDREKIKSRLNNISKRVRYS
ncbi:MAG: KEOPS complex kinase/ATPase Bud32, partial [Candidatus ainarchaeum sp.]|nr:KEOPS complex kinase/ATPase Bud32 [Candidatus ainarchaeum sp.]